jgi:hypothetical protein
VHKFSHGLPLAPGPVKEREEWDVGVRFCAWGYSRHMLVTGSSDGVVKTWDPYRAPGHAHTSDLISLQSGITSAAFSPDFTSLVLGEINRTVTVLEVGNKGNSLDDAVPFDFIRAKEEEKDSDDVSDTLDIQVSVAATSNDIKMKSSTNMAAERLAKSIVTDSNRHEDRIPTNLMAMLTLSDENLEEDFVKSSAQQIHKHLPVQARKFCAHCGGHARLPSAIVSEEGNTLKVNEEQEAFPLCERCGFSCFRCAKRIKVALGATKIKCGSCKVQWEIGTLGYHRVGTRDARCNKPVPKDNFDMDGAESLTFVGDVVDSGYDEYMHQKWGA